MPRSRSTSWIATVAERGRFITVEGTDGAGKSTQLRYMLDWLGEHGVDALETREPGGTALGEKLRDILLRNDEYAIAPEAELMLMFAARQQHLDEVILPAIEAGRWVVSDRFTDATYAYQGGGRGIPAERIELLETWVQGHFRPDLTLLLDLPVEDGLQRTRERGGDGDRFEIEALAFKTAVRQCYLERAAREPERIRVVDASAGVDAVSAAIGNELARLLDGVGE